MAGQLRRMLKVRSMPDGGMAAVDHGSRAGMEADRIPEIIGPSTNVVQHQVIDVPTSRAEQSNNISCPVVPHMRDSPTRDAPAVQQMVANHARLFARGCSRESNELVKYRHPRDTRFSLSVLWSLRPAD